MGKDKKSGKREKKEDKRRAEEEARNKADKKKATQRKHNKRPRFVVYLGEGIHRPATPDEIEHILAQRASGDLLGPRFARRSSRQISSDTLMEAAFRRAGLDPNSSEESIANAIVHHPSSKGWSTSAGKTKASAKNRRRKSKPESAKGWSTEPVKQRVIKKYEYTPRPASEKGWATGKATNASRPTPGLDLEKEITNIFQEAEQEARDQKERRFRKERFAYPDGKESDRKRRHSRRLREEGIQEAPTRAAYAYLLDLLPGELDYLLAHTRAYGVKPIKHEVELPESVPFSLGEDVVLAPSEELPTHLVLDRNGIPQAGKHACAVCGCTARKGHRTCKQHAKTEKWLPPLVLGPVVQAITGEHLVSAKGFTDEVWTQVWDETNEAIRKWRYRDGIDAIGNRTAVQKKRAHSIRAYALKKDRLDEVVQLIADAKPLIKEIEDTLARVSFPKTMVLKEKLRTVQQLLDRAEGILGLDVAFKKRRKPRPQKPTRRTKGAAGTGRHRGLRDTKHGGRWIPSQNAYRFDKLRDVLSSPVAAVPQERPASASGKSLKGWLVAATM